MEEDVEERIEDIQKDIESLEKKLLKEKKKDKRDMLEVELKELKAEMDKLKQESKQATKFLQESAKMEKDVKLLRAGLSNPDNEDDWLKMFSKMLENDLPKKLLSSYSEAAGGCLDKNMYSQVRVKCWPVSEFEAWEECEP